MGIKFRTDIKPATNAIIELYNSAGLSRPVKDTLRMGKMYKHSNLVVTAWDNNQLVGISRSVTDFIYCCYLADLAVRKEYQLNGIGKKLIELTKKKSGGNQTTLILLSAPDAITYYSKMDFEKAENCFKKLRIK